MLKAKAGWLAAATALSALSWPAAALADGQVRQPVQQVASTTSDALGEALGESTSPLPTLSGSISVVTTTIEAVASAAGATGSSGGSSGSTESGSTSGSAETERSVSTAKATSSGSTSSGRSSRAVASAGAAGMWPSAATSTLYTSFAPPPPRYGGINEGLALTGSNVTLPLLVLALLIAVAVGTHATGLVRDRYRAYGPSLRYRGRHRMPPRRRLRLAPAAA